jgi:multidrug resistance efflux pump
VQVAPVEARATRLSITVQGQAMPRTQAALAAQVSGRIVSVDPSFAAGGAFRRGQTLVRIDDADYRLAVIRARSQVAVHRVVAEVDLSALVPSSKGWLIKIQHPLGRLEPVKKARLLRPEGLFLPNRPVVQPRQRCVCVPCHHLVVSLLF